MIRFGLALKATEAPFHRCLVISETSDEHVVLVRITTDDGDWPDRACLLGPADWTELDKPSTVAYSTAKCSAGKTKENLKTAIKFGQFEVIGSPSDDVLRRVCHIGCSYKFTPPLVKTHIAVR